MASAFHNYRILEELTNFSPGRPRAIAACPDWEPRAGAVRWGGAFAQARQRRRLPPSAGPREGYEINLFSLFFSLSHSGFSGIFYCPFYLLRMFHAFLRSAERPGCVAPEETGLLALLHVQPKTNPTLDLTFGSAP